MVQEALSETVPQQTTLCPPSDMHVYHPQSPNYSIPDISDSVP